LAANLSNLAASSWVALSASSTASMKLWKSTRLGAPSTVIAWFW
jgi:hypothetical protein